MFLCDALLVLPSTTSHPSRNIGNNLEKLNGMSVVVGEGAHLVRISNATICARFFDFVFSLCAGRNIPVMSFQLLKLANSVVTLILFYYVLRYVKALAAFPSLCTLYLRKCSRAHKIFTADVFESKLQIAARMME